MTSRTCKTVLILACIAAIGMMAGCDQAEKVQEKVGGVVDLGAGAELTKLFGETTKSLGSITDLESAKTALPNLKNLDLDFGKIVTKFGEMSPDQKSKITSVVTKAMPQLESIGSKISALPGVGDIVGPTLTSMMSKIKSLS